jgi:hypothetical protein
MINTVLAFQAPPNSPEIKSRSLPKDVNWEVTAEKAKNLLLKQIGESGKYHLLNKNIICTDITQSVDGELMTVKLDKK